MTDKEFSKNIEEQYRQYKGNIIKTKNTEEIYSMSYAIAKMEAIYEYILDFSENLKDLYPYVNNLLQELYDFEFEYDTPQWHSWEKLDNMCSDYILWKEGKEI